MRKFKVVVEIVKEYVVEADESILTDKNLEGWESAFHDLDSEDDKVASLVHDYCECRARLGNRYLEGYGKVLNVNQKADGYFVKEDDVCDFMRMVKCDDDGDTVVYLEEIN